MSQRAGSDRAKGGGTQGGPEFVDRASRVVGLTQGSKRDYFVLAMQLGLGRLELGLSKWEW